ncbi:hypothetical protein CC80DRAFT_489944 [Byssothecium circinans]|uniref:Uncharacterized protein n=1 Tax=Byssothecium circinans TaxID=147558 RepID=A0A6A5U7D2_9PLEO|nr:hypothetical protein CC80DRAFT_489944 [Byssothecium circinans]
MSWMDSWSRPSKSQATPPPLYLTTSEPVPYCHSCGRVIPSRRTQPSASKTKPNAKTQEVKYCSARCKNTKPGPVDRKIENVFAALLDGASPESVKEGLASSAKDDGTTKKEDVANNEAKEKTPWKENEKPSKTKKKKQVKGDPRITIECSTVEELVFQHEKDPSKVFGRRKNRAPRGVVERPEDWRSVDMVDDAAPSTTMPSTASAGKDHKARDSVHSKSADEHSSNLASSSDDEDDGGEDGGITLNQNQEPPNPLPDSIPLSPYGFGSGKIRPPQSHSIINGSIGGEKGWAERIDETEEMKAKRREGQRRADEREMVRRAARRLVAFGVHGEGEEAREGRKCEAVMKGAVVEASFAKGEWGVRWREMV